MELEVQVQGSGQPGPSLRDASSRGLVPHQHRAVQPSQYLGVGIVSHLFL